MIVFDRVSYTYPNAAQPALRDLSLELPEGEFVLLVGPSGAGKSTLLRCLNGLVPHFSGGTLTGTLTVNGLNPVLAAPQGMSRHVGFVFQDPEAQFVLDRVEDELAFALENVAMPPAEMRVRVEEVLDLLDLAHLRQRRLDTLSGGERQRVAIAAALAFRPQILVLDEPTSQLDPQSAEEVLHALARLNSDLGLTIILAEHRLERVLPFADKLIYLGGGSEVRVGPPREILAQIDLVPPLVALARVLNWEPLPLTIKEGLRFSRKWLSANPTHLKNFSADTVSAPPNPPAGGTNSGQPYLRATQVEVSYDRQPVLRNVSLEVWPGEIVALLGRNGAGKSTLLKSLVGLVRPNRGHLQVAGRDVAAADVAEICRYVGYLPQDPNALLFAETVQEELLITLKNHGLLQKNNGHAHGSLSTESLLQRLGLTDKRDAYPRDLSAGERQRVALGAITITQPGALLLDEPTRGLDYPAKQQLIELLRQWRDEGMAILLVTHDVELAAALAGRVVLLSQGEIIASGHPQEVLGTSPFFAPQIARLFPGTGWLTLSDVTLSIWPTRLMRF
ncbi:MAG: ATP-binding cassette domain-containing protein [Anaerolineales bacterium]|nr:ATP-binding cassette domain-containing protein [Anaerolineales bacterium]